MVRNLNRPISPFRYWCQQALPLTFDDSLSYMELLSKVFAHLNACVADVATAEQDIVNLHNAYVQLQSYVNNYFDNLNVQTEIDHKIDEMVLNGTFSQLLDPVVAAQIAGVVADQIGAVVAAQIGDTVAGQIGTVVATQLPNVVEVQLPTVVGSEVSDWMDENLTPTTPVVDASLSVGGAAADAKVTGDFLKAIATIVRNILGSSAYMPLHITQTMNSNNAYWLYTNMDDCVYTKEEGFYVLYARMKYNNSDTGDANYTIQPKLFTGMNTSNFLGISYNAGSTSKNNANGSEFTTAIIYERTGSSIETEKLWVGFQVDNNFGTNKLCDVTVSDLTLIKFDSQADARAWCDANVPNIGEDYVSYYYGRAKLVADPIKAIQNDIEDNQNKLNSLAIYYPNLINGVYDVPITALPTLTGFHIYDITGNQGSTGSFRFAETGVYALYVRGIMQKVNGDGEYVYASLKEAGGISGLTSEYSTHGTFADMVSSNECAVASVYNIGSASLSRDWYVALQVSGTGSIDMNFNIKDIAIFKFDSVEDAKYFADFYCPNIGGDFVDMNGYRSVVRCEVKTWIPVAPSVNGTYVLKAVVNNGVTTYNWVAEN